MLLRWRCSQPASGHQRHTLPVGSVFPEGLADSEQNMCMLDGDKCSRGKKKKAGKRVVLGNWEGVL